MSESKDGLGRRELLQRGTAATLGAALLGLERAHASLTAEPPRVRRYRKLGKTGLEVSDISFGSDSMANPKLVQHALDRGITYFDTAESYPLRRPGRAEAAIGRAIAGRRDEVVIGTKTTTTPNMRREQLMRRLEASLQRLQTDRIDIYFNHAVNDLARLQNPEWDEFVAAAKQQGKIRYAGMSGHGGRLIECLDHALDENKVDVILAAHNFGSDPAFYERFTRNFDVVANQQGLPRVLAKARERGVGVLVMKTLMGARLNDMRPYEWGGATFSQAAFRWVFSQPDIDALVVSMKNRRQIDEYLAASGQTKVRPSDARLLHGYVAENASSQCRPGCGACEGACPEGVPIADVLRARMYATDYGEMEQGRATYAELGAGASACAGCTHLACRGTCPHRLEIPELVSRAHDLLGQA
jgi:predicted aldo/keto reductase-like oxidoreductase